MNLDLERNGEGHCPRRGIAQARPGESTLALAVTVIAIGETDHNCRGI
jgi:hypothetical protein